MMPFIEKTRPATLLAVTKNQPLEKIQTAIDAGVRDIGENRLQEIQQKYDLKFFHELKRQEVRMHFIGHLQKNKVNKVVRLCDVIQSVDSLELAQKISRAAQELNKTMPIFLQLNISGEEQKHGFRDDQHLPTIIEAIKQLPSITLEGLMTIGIQGDQDGSRAVFKRCRELADTHGLSECSMGMSQDYQIALEEGSTMVRIGRKLFEELDQSLGKPKAE